MDFPGSSCLRLMAVAALAALSFGASQASADVASAPVQTTSGLVAGESLPDGLTVFKGLPYAAPPVGPRRWTPPSAPAPWTGVRQATQFGPACMQPPNAPHSLYADDPPRMDEDCLYLNVWKPDQAPSQTKGAPVLVWIHGGAFTFENLASPLYDGAALARRGVIVVTLNYRVGILGFLAHPELSAESPRHVSGNYGLMDQIAALIWVKTNIAAFGGDPSNITIAGESAGGLSVVDLVASPVTRGLFAKAIAQSAYTVSNPELHKRRFGQPSAEAIGVTTLQYMGSPSIDQLRREDARTLLSSPAALGFAALPTVDGWVLPKQTVEIFDAGEQAPVPLMVGFNSGEIRSLRVLLPHIPASAAAYEQQVRSKFGDLADAYLALYPSSDVEGSVLAATRDGLYGWTAERLAVKQTALGQPAFLYLFDHGYPSEGPMLKAFHGSEIPFMFGQVAAGLPLTKDWLAPPHDPENVALSTAMVDYWTSFASTGVPVSAGAAVWKPFAEGGAYMAFRDRPEAGSDLMPGMYALTEELIARRRAAGNQPWFTNVGLATPTVPPRAAAKAN